VWGRGHRLAAEVLVAAAPDNFSGTAAHEASSGNSSTVHFRLATAAEFGS